MAVTVSHGSMSPQRPTTQQQSYPMLFSRLTPFPEHFSRNPFQVQKRAINARKVCIRFVKEQRQICSSKKNRVDNIPFANRGGKLTQLPVLLVDPPSSSGKFHIIAMD